jgi:hypothetical protein
MCYTIEHINNLLQIVSDRKLSVPGNWGEITPVILLSIYNGIGAEWMPRTIRRFISFVLQKMEPVALVHDVEYADNRKNYWLFTKANCRFIWNAIKMHHMFIGIACALLCQFFGWGAYKIGKDSMSYCNHYIEE